MPASEMGPVTCPAPSTYLTSSPGSQLPFLGSQALCHWPREMGKPVGTDGRPDCLVTPDFLIQRLFSFSFFVFQSNALPSHVKISVSRQTLFEDSFQQVRG